MFWLLHGNSLHNATARRTFGLQSSSSQQPSTISRPTVRHLYPTYTWQYITNFIGLVTPHKLCEFLTHTSTTYHHSGILTVLWQLALSWDTTHSFNKQKSFVKANWLGVKLTVSTCCEGWECKVYLHSVYYACTVWDMGKVRFHGIQHCCGYVYLASSSHEQLYIQTQTYVHLSWCWWLLTIGITT